MCQVGSPMQHGSNTWSSVLFESHTGRVGQMVVRLRGSGRKSGLFLKSLEVTEEGTDVMK